MNQHARQSVIKGFAAPFLVAALTCAPWPAAAQTSPPSTVDQDAVWSGVIEIKGKCVFEMLRCASNRDPRFVSSVAEGRVVLPFASAAA